MRPATSSDTAAPAWERRRLLAVLAAALVGAALLAGGLVYAVVYALNPPTPTAGTTGPAPIVVPAGTGAQYRDSVAAKPMLTVPPEASRPGAVAAAPGPALAVPPATTAGPGGVPAGFPHTPAGAVGQLAAIDSTVLTGMNLAAADEVYRAWSLDIARDAAGGWVMTAAVRAFLSAAKVPELTPGMSVVATPVAGQVKGSDGPDWVVACVLLRRGGEDRRHHPGRVRALRTDGLGRQRHLADRTLTDPGRPGPVDVARHPGRDRRRVGHLGRPGGGVSGL